ncbi:MAG: O-antigen ligase family protein [Ignavibacteriales bacterium]|nr:MAG: O-antigen ligase family protein [Ignavibacteriales bacterium]
MNLKLLLPAIMISIAVVIIPHYLIVMILLSAFIFIKEIISKELLLPLICFVMITASGETFEFIRNIINLSCTIVLIYLFVNKYGLRLSDYPRVPNKVLSFVIWFLLAMLISSSVSGFQLQSIVAIVRTITFFVIIYLFYSLINNQNQLYRLLLAFMVSTFVISLTIYYEVIQEGFNFFLISGILARYSGAYQGYNFIGYLMMVSTLIAFFFMLNRNGSKLLVGFYVLNNLIILMILNSRLAFFGTFIGIVIIIFMLKRKYFYALILSSILVLLLFLVVPVLNDYLQAYIRIESITERDDIWSQGMAMTVDHLFLGVGPELYPTKVYSYYSAEYTSKWEGKTAEEIGRESPHNYLLLMFSENGLLGFCSILFLYYLYFYHGIKAMKFYKVYNKDIYIFSLFITLIGILIMIRSFFEVDGILGYGFLSRDITFWLLFIFLIKLNINQKSPKIFSIPNYT